MNKDTEKTCPICGQHLRAISYATNDICVSDRESGFVVSCRDRRCRRRGVEIDKPTRQEAWAALANMRKNPCAEIRKGIKAAAFIRGRRLAERKQP